MCGTSNDFHDSDWLYSRLSEILQFYYPACVDSQGEGYLLQLDADTGELYDRRSKHLVGTTRLAVNFWRALAYRTEHSNPAQCEAALPVRTLHEHLAHALQFLRDRFRDADRGGYHWLLAGTDPVTSRRVCYGHAFVLLAFARGAQADLRIGRTGLADITAVLSNRFYEPEVGLYRSAFDADWTTAEQYRGQNANMHACEAHIAAFEATGDRMHLDRAVGIAETLCLDLAGSDNTRIWEHYTADWQHDFEYNRDEPADQFRPWGYQPGHHVEWAKLLAVLDRHLDGGPDWLLRRARTFFDYAVTNGWDDTHGGFYYTLDRDDEPLIDDKYGWPVAEAIGAAVALSERTGDDRYLDLYDRFWTYAESVLAAPAGNWYERVSVDGTPYSTSDGPAVEPGYHPIGACVEALRSL